MIKGIGLKNLSPQLVKRFSDKLCRLSGRKVEAVFSDPKLYEGTARGRKNG